MRYQSTLFQGINTEKKTIIYKMGTKIINSAIVLVVAFVRNPSFPQCLEKNFNFPIQMML